MKLYRVVNMVRNINNWPAYLLYKSKKKKGAGFTFELSNGFRVSVPNQIIPEFKESFFEEVYLKKLPAQLYSVSKPVIIDIGANVGFFSLLAWLKFPNARILAFEPIQRNFKLLQRNISGAPEAAIHPHHAAVSDTVGEIVLRFNDQAITTSASLLNNHTGNVEERVSSTNLAAIVAQHQLDKIDLLKLDCEGAEYGILYEAPAELFDRIHFIAMETHPGHGPAENTQSMAEYLKKMGYSVAIKGKDLLWATKRM